MDIDQGSVYCRIEDRCIQALEIISDFIKYVRSVGFKKHTVACFSAQKSKETCQAGPTTLACLAEMRIRVSIYA